MTTTASDDVVVNDDNDAGDLCDAFLFGICCGSFPLLEKQSPSYHKHHHCF